ncbi:DUF177 domain-containing protein [candidate division WOR-3 bacterium]|nr:DUF177 domain-containing protein [candidate division WOR-3 bacterium]
MIPVREITDVVRIEFNVIPVHDLELKDPRLKRIESIKAQVAVTTNASGITADFDVWFNATFACVRCLALFTSPCESRLVLTYVSGIDPHATGENVDLTRTEIERIYFSGPAIDLKIGIREAILLSLPIAPLCKEECAGLCEKCGVNKNTTQCDCIVEEPGLFTPINVPEHVERERLKKKRKDIQ